MFTSVVANPNPDVRLLEAMARPEETWHDIGAGVGRIAFPLSQWVRRVIASDPSPGRTARMREIIAEAPVDNVEVLTTPWPPPESVELVDVCVTANVTYFIADIGAFLDAMEQHARRLCVVMSTQLGRGRQPTEPLFTAIHGEAFVRLPALRELLALLGARGRRFDVQSVS
jgi:2-polyprenyl-3-methyl-5-hydroxy-6-metoxy-1,4-benzoquinol methylase